MNDNLKNISSIIFLLIFISANQIFSINKSFDNYVSGLYDIIFDEKDFNEALIEVERGINKYYQYKNKDYYLQLMLIKAEIYQNIYVNQKDKKDKRILNKSIKILNRGRYRGRWLLINL